MASIVLVDDHVVVMDALHYLIDHTTPHKISGKFKNGGDFLKALENKQIEFEVAIIDIRLPDINGIDLVSHVKTHFPEAKVILLSMYHQSQFVYAGLKQGISGYLLKSSSGDELTRAIDCVLLDEIYLSAEVAKIIKQPQNDIEGELSLTEREQEILELITYGFSSKEIADKLIIEVSTVDFHKKNLRQKMNVNKSVELVIKALELGLVKVA